MKIDVLGTTYKIKRKKLGSEEIDGYTDYTDHVIVIRKDNYNKVGNFKFLMDKQLRHEIIHAFLAESGLQSNFEHYTKFGHEETMVDWYAIQYPKIKKVFDILGI